jgi:hypothetical protein
MSDRATCRHVQAYIVAVVGDPDTPLDWAELDLARPTELDDLAEHHVSVCLGVCAECGATVVGVRTSNHVRWTAEHGPAWSTRWTPLLRNGEVVA